ncbi:MAG TPA: sodium:solute symporter family protein [Terriglobales bacterium]|nr:sodium:solute symporter family protein [Terriglobales bacterium]
MNLYVSVLAVIVATLLGVSLFRSRTVKNKADFLVAGRSLPAYVLIATLLCSWIGAGSLFAGAENAAMNGFAALWQPAGGWIGLLIIYFVAPRARKFAQFTLPDLLETRYNAAARVLGTIAILFAYTAICSYQFRGGGDILHLATGIDATTGMFIVAGFVIVFTALAGMSSVAYADVVIGVLVTVTTLIATPMLFYKAGGWEGLHAALPPDRFQVLGNLTFTKAMEFFVPTFLLMLGNQSMYQKFFSAKDERAAKIAVGGWIVGTFFLETVIIAIAVFGTAIYGKSPELMASPRETIPFVARHGLPAFMGALLMGAVFAKVISTANNYLFSPATNLVEDVYSRFINKNASHRQILVLSRVAVVGLGVFALVQGAYWTSVLAMALYAYTVYSAAITPVVMSAFFWKRATAAGAVTSIGLGTFVTIAWNYGGKNLLPPSWAERDAIFPAMIVSLISLVVVSLLTRPPRREQWAPFFDEKPQATEAVAVEAN